MDTKYGRRHRDWSIEDREFKDVCKKKGEEDKAVDREYIQLQRILKRLNTTSAVYPGGPKIADSVEKLKSNLVPNKLDTKKIYIAKDLNEPIRTSTVKEFTDELVRDHADVCIKKGEKDKGVDREYIRLQRILKRLNTTSAVYPGGPKIADSVEKLKSNLAPNKNAILRDETDSKIIYIAKDLNEPIRTSTVKEFTDELVRDHADVCKKKGEEDKGVDREYIRLKRILKRLNTTSAVYQGGPKIADSVEKLKSNLAPNKKDILRDETDSKIIYIAKDLNETIRTSTVKEFTDELVRDHADDCIKKGEKDKGVDREYIRLQRILQRLNTTSVVYLGGPKIADSVEKLKSNLVPNKLDSKIIYIAKDLNEPIRTSTVKEFTDELVRDHADVCKKKGEEDKGVDREYIRLQRILHRLNTTSAVYLGGPKIADSVEKLKSNLVPNKKDILRDETDSKIIYIAKDLNEPIRTSTVKEFTDELVRDHADDCKKKGEKDKGVDREYIRLKRILSRLNVRTVVYPGGPKIADSVEKLKSNLAPDTTDQDNSLGGIRAEDINVNDVICAKGRQGISSRPGNQAYLKLIKEKKNRYKSAKNKSPKNSKDKASIAEEVLDTMRKKNPPGRFLKKCTDSETYTELSNKEARTKVVQALRLAK